jgi:protein-tyrosine kinase
MEKLQKALQKAREQREPIHRQPLLDATPVADMAETRAPVALWEALDPFEPTGKALEKSRIVTAAAGPAGVSFDILRTKILLAMRKNGWKRLAVTSPTMGCGKTTTSCNLAIGYARNTDMHTILLEFDLRRPSIARTLGLPERPDLVSMLEDRIDFGEQALRYRSNVAIAAATRSISDPSSVLTSKTTHAVLQDIEDSYAPDIVIFDLPPLLVTDDTRAVLKDMDCAILVAKSGTTTVAQIDVCEREIAEHTNMLGVLNQCQDADDDYGYYD